jgi:2-dehydro-3-deoxyphosphogluconate aldolase/(4S)-4-hydroxy-2-oxoglutarate aldolase
MTPWTPDARAAAVDAVFDRAPVMPVLAIERLEDALPLGRALVDAGLPVLEVTLRTACALEAIALLARELRAAVVGAGTVLTPADLNAVSRAGAAFAIAPGSTPGLYAAAARSTIPFIPAVATASEIMQGLEHGHRRFKFFPAVPAGGVAALKAFAGPFPLVRFCPTGGIDAASAPSFLALPNVGTVGGSWMVPADALRTRDWTAIGALARAAAGLRGSPPTA